MSVRVAINGFGRIGRAFFRTSIGYSDIDIVAINNRETNSKTLAHLLKYDSVHGVLREDKIDYGEDAIIFNGKKIDIYTKRNPLELPWSDLDVDIVLESTGVFRDKKSASKHLEAGAKKVILSAPAKGGDIPTVVLGVNDKDFNFNSHDVISNASCTTNCIAPVAKILNDNFGIIHGSMTTVHSYTNDQRILDLKHSDLRRARAAAENIIPTTTGAAIAVGLVIPQLRGKLDGVSIRVPTPNVSLVDFVIETEKAASISDVNNIIKQKSESELRNILEYTEEPLVSRDINGNPHSSVFDALSTMVIDNHMVKILSWYDNEWGYSSRLRDLILKMKDYV